MNEKIALCCIAKNENRYILEFVEHYKNLGFDKIFLYDNNDIDGEVFDDVLKGYIDSGLVDIIDYRGRQVCQLSAYVECYNNLSSEYEWIAFFDCDEFLTLNGFSNVHDYLSQEMFSDTFIVKINWMVYDDNDLVRYDGRPLLERFTRPCDYNITKTYMFPENFHIKSIIRRGIKNISFSNPHTPNIIGIPCRNNKGDSLDSSAPFSKYDFTLAYLKHFNMKTVEEYAMKVKRGYPDQTMDSAKSRITIGNFFKMNKKTLEKENVWIETVNKTDIA